MTTPTIRTSDPVTRAQQWARVSDLTTAFLQAQDEIHDLRLCIHALKTCQQWEWQIGEVDLELNTMLQKRIRSRLDALRASTDNILIIQAELKALENALEDNYEGGDREPV